MTAVCLASDTPAAESHTRPVACYFYRGACQPEDPPGVFTQGGCIQFFTAGHASPKTPSPWGFHPGQLENIFCLTSEACQPAQAGRRLSYFLRPRLSNYHG